MTGIQHHKEAQVFKQVAKSKRGEYEFAEIVDGSIEYLDEC